MAGTRKLVVEILGDSKGLSGALDESSSKLEGWGSKIGKTAAIGAAALGGLGLVGGKALLDLAKGAAEDEAASASLAKTLKNVTLGTEDQIAAVEDYISSITKATGVMDDDLRPAFDVLARGTGSIEKSQELMAIAMDVSAGTGKDLTSVTEALSKAYAGNMKGLRALDPQMANLIKEGGTAEEAFAALNKTFGGQTALAAETTAGKMKIASAQFAEFKESIGAKVLPVLAQFAEFVTANVLPALERFSAWAGEHIPPILQAIAGFIREQVVPALKDLAGWVEENLLPAIMKLWASFEENILPTLRDKILPVLAQVGEWILKYVLPAVGKLVTFILGDLIPAIFKVIGWFSEHLGPALEKIGEIVIGVKTKFEEIVAFIRGIPENIREAARGMWDGITDAFKAAMNTIIRGWNRIEFKIPGFSIGPVGYDGFTLGVPDIPTLHSGGTFRSPNGPGTSGMAWLQDGERVSRGGSAGGITIIVQGSMIGTERELVSILKRAKADGITV